MEISKSKGGKRRKNENASSQIEREKRIKNTSSNSSESTSSTNNETTSKFYHCPICTGPIYFTRKLATMNSHLNTKHPDAKVDGTDEKLTAKYCVVTSEKKIQEILNSTKKTLPFPCSLCEKSFTTRNILNRHKRQKHLSKFKFCCTVPLCGRLECDSMQMKQHYDRSHGETYNYEDCKDLMAELYKIEQLTGIPVKQAAYPCPMCDELFEFSHLLKRHMSSQIHDPTKRTCNVCWKIFSSKKLLRRHGVTHDNSLRSFRCTKGDECQRSFVSSAARTRHEKYSLTHAAIPQFSCEKCEVKFRWPMSLRRHQNYPCPPKRPEPGYLCKICEKPYHLEKSLFRHEKRHEDGTLNLKVPPDHMIKIYRQMIYVCNQQIYIDHCNRNKTKRTANCHLIVVPCNHVLPDKTKCQKQAVMFSSQPTPWHHIRKLLYQMIRGRACTSLHSHFEGTAHTMDIAAAKFVVGGRDSYEVHMVKKLVVKMAKQEEPVTVTNFTEYEPHHLYDKSAIDEVISIMRQQKLTSRSEGDLRDIITSYLDNILDDGDTVRGHSALIFKDNLFQFKKRDDDKITHDQKLEQYDEEVDDEDGDGDDEEWRSSDYEEDDDDEF